MKDCGKIILAVLGGFVIGAKVQDLIDLKRFIALNQKIRSLKASEDQAWKERDESMKEADELRHDAFVLRHCNEAQGMLLIEQQREIKDLRGHLYN